jgi:hypothetical protein
VRNNQLYCWRDAALGNISTFSGPFQRLSTASEQICAIRKDGFAQCLVGGELTVPPFP